MSVSWDTASDAEGFVEEHHIPYPEGYDSGGAISNLYKVDETPTTLFIAKDGKVMERHEGEMEKAEFEQRIQKLLAE